MNPPAPFSDHSDEPLELPPPPERPDCCGSGCSVCVLEIYQDELERWQQTVEALREAHARRQQASRGGGSD